MSSDNQVFVVMQVGSEGSLERKRADEIYEWVIVPTLAQFDLVPYRADLDPSPGSITPKLLSELIESRAIIADLTGRNANVFYELGIAHSFTRPLVCIADSAVSLPFDAKDERVIEVGAYSEAGLTITQGNTANKKLQASIQVILAENYLPPSPLREVAANRSLDALAPENPIAAELAQMREDLADLRGLIISAPVDSQRAQADVAALRRLLEGAVMNGHLDIEYIRNFAEHKASKATHQWADKLVEKWEAARDPWASPESTRRQQAPDPWASTANTEDPPF